MENRHTGNIYFANLDLLRFLAAFMVVIAHAYEGWCGWWGYLGFMSENSDHKTLTTFGGYLNNVIKNGGFGVEVFFLISGFLITYILLVEKETTGRIDIKKFFIRRGFRIWPLYFFLIAVAPFIIEWLEKPSPNYIANIFFYNNFNTMITGNWEYPFAHFWSICIEEHFYLVWPFLIAFIPNKHLLNVFWSVIIISALSRYGFNASGKGFYYTYLHTLSRMDVLAIGAIGAYMHFNNSLKFSMPKIARIGLYLLFIIIYADSAYNMYESNFLATLRKYFYVAVIAVGMLHFLFNPDALIKFKNKNFIHYLGKISYGIYMYSNILIAIIMEKIIVHYNIANMYIYFLLNIGLTIAISIISYELFEKQFLKLKKRFEVVKTNR
ncbi:MAG: acyltransferase [Bacteroidota bacterium]